MNTKKFDIIVYGATGFTGRLVAQYLHTQYGNGGETRWAMAVTKVLIKDRLRK